MAQGRSFKDVVNEAIVSALAPGQTRPFHSQTYSLGKFNPVGLGLDYDQNKALALAGLLEDIELAKKREMGK